MTEFSGSVSLSPGQEKRTTTIKEFPLGTRALLGERVFRYARAGAGLTAGQLCQHKALRLSAADSAMGVDTDVAVGGRTIVVNLPSTHDTLDADEFDDGVMYVVGSSDAPGLGQMYKILTHTATQTGVDTGGDMSFTLAYDDGVADTPLTSASVVQVIENFYNRVVPTDIDTVAQAPVGVAPVVVASESYFWLQTWGPCPVRSETGTRTPSLGAAVIWARSTSDFAGAVELPQEFATALDVVDTVNASGRDYPHIGFAVGIITGDTAGDDGTTIIWLMLAP